jgi:hypothetical protein
LASDCIVSQQSPARDRAPTRLGRRGTALAGKSTEHNLDLAFTSLDVQREACEAHIVYKKSQAHEGWRFLPDQSDFGMHHDE